MAHKHAALGAGVLAAITIGGPVVAWSGPSADKAAGGAAAQAEQLVRDGRDSFAKPDYAQAQRSLEKAVALCARDPKPAPACADLTLEASFLLGKIYEDQKELAEAMQAFQRVVGREASGHGKTEQQAYSLQAIARLSPRLGKVIVAEKSQHGCKENVLWVRPGLTKFRVNDRAEAVNVRAGQTVQLGSCE